MYKLKKIKENIHSSSNNDNINTNTNINTATNANTAENSKKEHIFSRTETKNSPKKNNWIPMSSFTPGSPNKNNSPFKTIIKEEFIKYVQHGEIFGNEDLILRNNRNHSAVSTEYSECLVLDEFSYESTIKVSNKTIL